MSDAPAGVRSSSRGLWLLVYVLLLPAVVLPLLIPLYDRSDPTLAGFPFYYWFQMAMIPVAVVLTVSAYYVARAADRIDREAKR
jgi:ABC-type transport system involved in cytochrome c biogenesis permease component